MTSLWATKPPEGWQRARFSVDDFLLLRKSGAFAGYHKSELLEGEIWGVFRAPDDCGQWDDMVPILLRPIDHDVLLDAGVFAEPTESKLIDGAIWVSTT